MRSPIRSTADFAAVAAAVLAAKIIANAGHRQHTADHVGPIMTSNEALQHLRDDYVRHITNGLDPRNAIRRAGKTAAASYCARHKIPTSK
jgi:hypothetical protein